MKRRRPLTTQAMLSSSSMCAGVRNALPIQMRGSTESSSSGILFVSRNPGRHVAIGALCSATAGGRSKCEYLANRCSTADTDRLLREKLKSLRSGR